jgi:undecaprenyl-diphosphatase
MTLLHAVILGIVEGITEFLPISSTGHLILTSYFLRIGDSDFVKSFEIIIQLGAITAVILLYWRRFFSGRKVWGLLIASFIPTALIGLALYSYIKTYLLGNVPVVIGALLLGGIGLIAFELWKKEDDGREIESLTYAEAFVIGLAQSFALIPGVSRSAATIITGRAIKLSRKAAVEFSFLLSVPIIVAASGLDLVKHADNFSRADISLLTVGFMTALIVAALSIVTFLKFIKNHSFISFGIYRIIVAVIFFFAFLHNL